MFRLLKAKMERRNDRDVHVAISTMRVSVPTAGFSYFQVLSDGEKEGRKKTSANSGGSHEKVSSDFVADFGSRGTGRV